MAITVGGTSITFNDGTTQTTAAGGVPSAYAVGAYVTACKTTGGTTNTTAGETIAGSSLRFANEGGAGANRISLMNAITFISFSTNPGLSGTWRAMGPAGNGGNIVGSTDYLINTVWARIS